MALLELLSGESSFIAIPIGSATTIMLDPIPMLFTSPVSTALPNLLRDEDEEQDDSTLGRPEPTEELE